MTKDNVLFAVIGLLVGLIGGFLFANTVNQRGYIARSQNAASSTAGGANVLPGDHPPLPSNAVTDQSQMNGQTSGQMPPEIKATIQKARDAPDDFEAQTKAAELYYQIKRYPEALEYLTRANRIRPDSYETIVNLGNTNFDAGNYPTAEKWYTAALAKNSDDVSVRTDLGLTFLFREPADYDRAIKEFRRSLEINPKHEQTLQNLTVALMKKGATSDAQEALKRLEAVNPQNKSIEQLRTEIQSGAGGAMPKTTG